jgi:hypothetical protein
VEHLYLRGLCWGIPGGGASLLGIQKDLRRRAQGTGISLRGGPVGEVGRVLVCRGLCKLWRWASLSLGALWNTWGGFRSPGTLEK